MYRWFWCFGLKVVLVFSFKGGFGFLVYRWFWLSDLNFVAVFWFKGDCLLDQPQKSLALPDAMPGSSYSLNRQCELAFGTGSKPCPYMQSCAKLWCTGKARGQLVCQTRHFPWADGTSCGDSKLCVRGVCTDKHNATKPRVSQHPPEV